MRAKKLAGKRMFIFYLDGGNIHIIPLKVASKLSTKVTPPVQKPIRIKNTKLWLALVFCLKKASLQKHLDAHRFLMRFAAD